MDHQLEAVRQQGLQHEFSGLGSGTGGGIGNDVEAVEFQPIGSAEHSFLVDAVSNVDQIHHGGESQLIPSAAIEGAFHNGNVAVGANMDVGGHKGRPGSHGECGSGGLGERRTGKNDEKTDIGEQTHLIVTSLRLSATCFRGADTPVLQ